MSGVAEIVRYRPEHKDAVARLQTVLWSPDPEANRRFFEWKYEANPWAAEPRIYLALRDGRVVGMRGFCESRWEAGSPARVVAVPLADDFAISPSERNTGLAAQIMRTALADLADAGFDYAFSLSAGPITMLSSLAQGWKSAGRVEALARRSRTYAWSTRVRERMRRARGLWRLSDASLANGGARAPFQRIDAAPLPEGVEIARSPRPEAMAALIAELGHDGRIRHVRSRDYLAWRYAHPMQEYRFLYAARGDHLDGYLALRARPLTVHPTPRVCIADLEGRDARVRVALLAAAIGAGRFAELVAWAVHLGPAERALLRERGFAPLDPHWDARGGPCALVRATRSQLPAEWSLGSRALLDPASWDLRMLYSMHG